MALRSDRAHDGGPAAMSNGESLLILSGQRTVWGLPRAWVEGPSGQGSTSADINPGTAPTGESSTESQERFWAESLPLSQHTELPGQSSSAPTLSYALRRLAPHDSPEATTTRRARAPGTWGGGWGATIPTRDVAGQGQHPIQAHPHTSHQMAAQT